MAVSTSNRVLHAEEGLMAPVGYRTADVDGFKVFYREAGQADAPKLLLLHGFPTAGHMFRDLIPLLADRFHIVAPDLPGFGQSDMPPREKFSYTFDNIARVIGRFTDVIGLDRFAVYVFDYGAPTGFRLAVSHPERITAIISQNGNAYEEGLSEGWKPIRAPIGSSRRRPIGRRCAPSWLPKRRAGNTPMASSTRRRFLRMGCRWTTSTWRAEAPTRFSSTCWVTTKPTSHSTRLFNATSAPTGRRCWRCGARTIRFSCQPVLKRSSAIFRLQPSASSTQATLRWKRMPQRSRRL